jgi:hypothetical protein
MGNGSTKQNALRGWYENHKDRLVSGVSQTAKVSAAVASEAANVAMDTLLSSGKEAALKTLRERMPSVGSAAPSIVNAMESQLYAGVNAETYSPYLGKTGRGEPGFYGGVSDFAYKDVVERCGGFSGGFDADVDFAEGGCGCRGGFIGSDELDTTTVRDYANSRNSVTKGKIIDEIIEIVSKLGIKVSGDTLQAKIKSLLEQIPSGDKFKQSPETHRKTCLAIAEAINRIHGSTIINKTMPADVICQQVAEVISSLGAGMHTEFLAVYNDVRKVLKNLHIIKNALKDDHQAIVERVKSSDDALLPDQLTTLNDLHGILTDEIDRQISMLQNLLNITLFPTEKDLAGLIKSKKDLHGYIEKIDVKVGSERFGKVISDILKGLGLTANFALLIERALKTVGITLDEYAKGSSTQKLREKITQNLMGKNLTEEQLHEYLEAADLLYRNFYRNQDIAKTLEVAHEKSGKFESMYTGTEISGGDDRYQRTVMDKRIADRKKLRGLIFNTFYKQLNDIFDRFVGSLDALSLKVGEEIPLSDQLDGLRHVMQRINESLVRNKNIYYALIGYYNDAMSKNKKDTLLGELKMVSSFIDTILELPMYKSSAQYFTAVQGNIKAMVDLIERFSDEIAAKFGRGEEIDPTAQYEGAYDNPDAVFGGVELPSQLEMEPKIVYKPTKSIHDAIRQFDYKYRVAQIRQNMNRASKELSHYSEKYEKIIANSIADILESEKKKYERLRKELSDMEKFKAIAPAPAAGAHDLAGYEVADAEGFRKADEIRAEHAAALKFLDSQWEAKKKFWATIEAVDSYMRVFTDALVKNPNDIKEIKSMLDEIEVINDWYSDGTGNDLVGVFEHFPSFVKGDAVTSAGSADARQVMYPPAEYIAKDSTHYYARIGKNLNKKIEGALLTNDDDVIRAALPGNPHLVVNKLEIK